MTLLVGLDAREAFRQDPRGIGLYCRHLIREYGQIGGDFRILAYHERPTPSDLPPLPPCTTARQATMRGGRFHLWERLRMPWQIGTDRLDVYHGTYNTLPPRLLGARRVPMVVSIHDVIVTWWDEDLHDPYVRYCRAVTPRVVRDARKILTVSEWSKRDLCERYRVPAGKVDIFWNGVHPLFLTDPPEPWGPAARAKFADGRPYLFAIGSHQRRKNTGGLVRALGILRRQGRLDHLLVVTGLPGAAAEALRTLARDEGVGEHVRVHGYVTREELVGLYLGAALTVYPSHAEGWGIPVVESLAVGTPVVTSSTTAMPEAGGEFAEYFDPAQPEDIAAAIERALRGIPAFLRKRDAAKARARRFTWRAAAEKTLAVYREVAG
jgi:glycosyltransferase involved in cell wall biosynthesis